MLALTLLVAALPQDKPAFRFAGQEFYKRWSEGNSTEYTPKGQQDLEAWTEMLTVNDYPNVKDGEGLAKAANGTLDAYGKAGGQVIGTRSVPKTAAREAEHLIVVLFERPKFSEVAFARFLIRGERAGSVVSSRRAYGEGSGKTLRQWLAKNGPAREKELMEMKSVPGW